MGSNKKQSLLNITIPQNKNKFQSYTQIAHIIDNIYLSDYNSARDIQTLTLFKITHIINCSPQNCKNIYENKIQYLNVEILDEWDANLIDHIDSIFKFIQKAQKLNGRVLIHCYRGISRSPSVVIAYIIKNLNINENQALKYCKSRYQQAEPNASFMIQLQQYYKNQQEELRKNQQQQILQYQKQINYNQNQNQYQQQYQQMNNNPPNFINNIQNIQDQSREYLQNQFLIAQNPSINQNQNIINLAHNNGMNYSSKNNDNNNNNKINNNNVQFQQNTYNNRIPQNQFIQQNNQRMGYSNNSLPYSFTNISNLPFLPSQTSTQFQNTNQVFQPQQNQQIQSNSFSNNNFSNSQEFYFQQLNNQSSQQILNKEKIESHRQKQFQGNHLNNSQILSTQNQQQINIEMRQHTSSASCQDYSKLILDNNSQQQFLNNSYQDFTQKDNIPIQQKSQYLKQNTQSAQQIEENNNGVTSNDFETNKKIQMGTNEEFDSSNSILVKNNQLNQTAQISSEIQAFNNQNGFQSDSFISEKSMLENNSTNQQRELRTSNQSNLSSINNNENSFSSIIQEKKNYYDTYYDDVDETLFGSWPQKKIHSSEFALMSEENLIDKQKILQQQHQGDYVEYKSCEQMMNYNRNRGQRVFYTLNPTSQKEYRLKNSDVLPSMNSKKPNINSSESLLSKRNQPYLQSCSSSQYIQTGSPSQTEIIINNKQGQPLSLDEKEQSRRLSSSGVLVQSVIISEQQNLNEKSTNQISSPQMKTLSEKCSQERERNQSQQSDFPFSSPMIQQRMSGLSNQLFSPVFEPCQLSETLLDRQKIKDFQSEIESKNINYFALTSTSCSTFSNGNNNLPNEKYQFNNNLYVSNNTANQNNLQDLRNFVDKESLQSILLNPINQNQNFERNIINNNNNNNNNYKNQMNPNIQQNDQKISNNFNSNQTDHKKDQFIQQEITNNVNSFEEQINPSSENQIGGGQPIIMNTLRKNSSKMQNLESVQSLQLQQINKISQEGFSPTQEFRQKSNQCKEKMEEEINQENSLESNTKTDTQEKNIIKKLTPSPIDSQKYQQQIWSNYEQKQFETNSAIPSPIAANNIPTQGMVYYETTQGREQLPQQLIDKDNLVLELILKEEQTSSIQEKVNFSSVFQTQ